MNNDFMENDVFNAIDQSNNDSAVNGVYSDDNVNTTLFHVAYDSVLPRWCYYNGTDAFKIAIFLSIVVVPAGMFAWAYSFRMWKAKVDIVHRYLAHGMSVRGTVVGRQSKTRKDYEGRTYHSQEIVVEYEPMFVARLVEEDGNEDEGGECGSSGIDDNACYNKTLVESPQGNGSISCGRIVYRKRIRVSKDTFHFAAFGSIRLLVLEDSRSAFPARELAHLQLHSGVCWVWCFGLIVMASLIHVGLNAACAALWYCWLASILIASLSAYVTLKCTSGLYHNFIDSIVVGDTQKCEKDNLTSSNQGGTSKIRFTRLTRVQSEPAQTTTSANEVKCARFMQSENFVVACPLVKL